MTDRDKAIKEILLIQMPVIVRAETKLSHTRKINRIFKMQLFGSWENVGYDNKSVFYTKYSRN